MIEVALLTEGGAGCLESMEMEVGTRWSGTSLWECSNGSHGFGLRSTEVKVTRIDTSPTYELADK